ncbi:MAG: hypothetical protein ABI847_07405 [Anaerolineales bacterium]
MTTPSVLPQPAVSMAARSRLPLRRRYQAAGLALTALGALLLLANLGLLRADARRAVTLVWAGGLVLAGAWLALRRWRLTWLPLEHFALARGQFERASLIAATGGTDLELRALPDSTPLAAGEYAAPAGPRLEALEGGAAQVWLDARHTWPLQASARWPVGLARGLPWRLDLQSGLGRFDLDLSDMTVAELRLRSAFGAVNLTLPAAGVASLQVDLTFGDLTVRVPDGMAMRLKFSGGPLSEFQHDERRFVRLGPDEWATPLYAVAANRCTLAVRLWSGDFTLV